MAKKSTSKAPRKATAKKAATKAKERVLITGAAGFLGSHLCDRFIKEGYHVIGMDNLITGRLKNIEHLFKRSDFEFYHHDVSTFVHVPGELKYILHFASPASPIDYLKIEGDFIANMLNSDKDRTFVTSIRSLAREMGITVVAEYVESAAVLDELVALEIQRAQGYYIGRPARDLLPVDWLPPAA